MDVATPGTVIGERYRLIRRLGAGSSATVWEAADTALDRAVAVKLLHGPAAADPAERERLRREALALARLAHPRIVVVFDYLEVQLPGGTSIPVLVTELLHGPTLAQRLQRAALPVTEALAVGAQLADALRAAHRAGIVHRDVKPGNVILTGDGLKLLDFGIARNATDRDPTGQLVIGTPACMSPEQLTGQQATCASDVYALGCVLYWCLTGRPPYPGPGLADIAQAHLNAPPPPLIVPGLPPRIADLCAAALAKDPARRPSAEQILGELSQPTPPAPAERTRVMPVFDTATHPSALQRPAPAPTRRARLALGALLIAALAAGATALVLKGVGGNTPSPGTSATGSASAATATPSATDTAAPQTTDSPTADPGQDPIGYVDGMASQVRAFAALGPDNIAPNTATDLVNALADLHNALSFAAQNGNKDNKPVLDKISALKHKISHAADNGNLSQDVADQLTGELQALSDALTRSSSGNGGQSGN